MGDRVVLGGEGGGGGWGARASACDWAVSGRRSEEEGGAGGLPGPSVARFFVFVSVFVCFGLFLSFSCLVCFSLIWFVFVSVIFFGSYFFFIFFGFSPFLVLLKDKAQRTHLPFLWSVNNTQLFLFRRCFMLDSRHPCRTLVHMALSKMTTGKSAWTKAGKGVSAINGVRIVIILHGISGRVRYKVFMTHFGCFLFFKGGPFYRNPTIVESLKGVGC